MQNDQKNCGSVDFVTEEGDGAGGMRSGSTAVVDVETNLKAFFGGLPHLRILSSAAELSARLEYQHQNFFCRFHPVAVRHIKY
jgi:hypothetical protein